MSNEVILLILRIISGLLLIAFLGAIYRILWRDQRRAAAEIDMKRQTYGYLVLLREIDGHYHLTGEKYMLKPITSLGRSPTNTVPISDNFSSSEHALVTLRQGQWWLEDRNSRNGTLLNNAPVKQPVVIANGDIIGIGQIKLRMDLESVRHPALNGITGDKFMAEQVQIAVIGGSGLYNMPEISDVNKIHIPTPFGDPSGEIVIGTLRGKRVAFLPRHGVGHIYSPTTVPYKANIYALKSLGVRFIIGVNACGSLKEEYAPGNIVIPDQLFDYTNSRDRSFFGTGLVAHVGVAEPYCTELGDVVFQAVQKVGGTAHRGGTFLIEEGPRFATRAESLIFIQWGCSLIGMTTCPEAFLAREAEIAYATMAHVTDYDSWHVTEEPVTVEMVMSTFHHNIEVAQKALAAAVESLDENAVYACHSALANAIMTDRSQISPEIIETLKPIVGRYFPS